MNEGATDDGLRADRALDRRIGEILRTHRLAISMSMETLGRHVGVTYQQIQKYETGANRIPASTLYQLARALRCGLGTFFDGIDTVDMGIPSVMVSPDDATAARSLDLIEDPVVRDALRNLVALLGNEHDTTSLKHASGETGRNAGDQ